MPADTMQPACQEESGNRDISITFQQAVELPVGLIFFVFLILPAAYVKEFTAPLSEAG